VARRKASATQPLSVNRQERSVLSPLASLRGKRRDTSAAHPLSWVGIAFRSQRRDTAKLKLMPKQTTSGCIDLDQTGSLEEAGGATRPALRCRALSSPPLPSARAVYVRTRPQRGLAGVFCISGSHLVQLVPQFESGQNCSDCLLRPAQPSKWGS
jgi:hypothetical protein